MLYLAVARVLVLWQLRTMRLNNLISFRNVGTFGLAAIVAVLSTSCGTLPELPSKQVGPVSSEGSIPWNRRLPGEGSAALGGLGGQ